MSDEQRMVTEFHRAFDVVIGTSPAIPDPATCALRMNLIQEEFDELREALTQGDVEAVAKELADVLYVVYGTAVSCGIDMAPVFREVHRSNMSKVGGHKRADGKWIKPPNYSPASLQPILTAQDAQISVTGYEYHDTSVQNPPTHTDMRRPDLSEFVHTSGPGLAAVSQAESPASASTSGGSVWSAERLALLTSSANQQQAQPTPHDDTTKRRPRTRPCARCGKNFIQRSHRKGTKERLLSLAYIYPFRCQVCGYRFKAFQFRVRYTKKLVDRRQYERLPTQVPTTFVESGSPREYRVGQGVVTDISLKGCYLQTASRLLEGMMLSLELQTAEHAPALVVEAAIVRSVRPTGVGLEFLRLHESEHIRLSQFIRQLLSKHLMAEHEMQSP